MKHPLREREDELRERLRETWRTGTRALYVTDMFTSLRVVHARMRRIGIRPRRVRI